MKAPLVLALILAAGLPFLTCEARATSYQARPLPTPTGLSSEARAINSSGAAAGAVEYPKAATLWGGGSSTALVPEYQSWTYAINDSGHCAGRFFDDSNYDHLFVWQPDTGMADLGRFDGSVEDMNESDQIVGYSLNQGLPTAYLWNPGQGMMGLSGVEAVTSIAHAINDSGEVVGYAQTSNETWYAFLWSASAGVQNIVAQAEARAISSDGRILGLLDSGGMFVWADGGIVATVAPPNGYAYILPNAINDSGTVAGTLWDGQIKADAFAWSADTGFTILGQGEAYDINNKGQVAGKVFVSHDPDGSETWRAVVWEPVPEPSSLMALAFGLTSLAAAVQRRTR